MAERRKFREEFKREAVQLTRQPDASVPQIAHDIGVRPNLLWRWRRELERGSKAFPGRAVRPVRRTTIRARQLR